MVTRLTKKVLLKALRQAKPRLNELNCPKYSAHYQILMDELAYLKWKVSITAHQLKAIFEIMNEEIEALKYQELKEWLEDPRRRKALELLYS